MSTRPAPTLWVGPIAFAAVMIAIVGLYNAITGLAAILSDEVYVDAPGSVLVLDVTGWGWVHLITGVGMLAVGICVLGGQAWARALAAGLVALNMTTQLLLLPAYPFWAVLTIALDVVIVWALVLHGHEIPDASR